MVKQHILIGLGLKKQNFRNRAIHYMLNRAGKAMGGALPHQDQRQLCLSLDLLQSLAVLLLVVLSNSIIKKLLN